MRTLGVDLAASPKSTAACVIDWAAGTVVLLPRPVDDAAIVAAALDVDKVGIDVPFGWPDAFVEAVHQHHRSGRWPDTPTQTPADRQPFRFRATDVVLMDRGIRPLSVSTDLIGVPAIRGAGILRQLAARGMEVDRSGVTGRVAETYPAGALRTWGLPHSGYKGRANRAALAELIEAFGAACGSLGEAIRRALVDADDDDLDAVVCAVLARAVALGRSTAPSPAQLAAARREGWIHLATATPDEVVNGPPKAPSTS